MASTNILFVIYFSYRLVAIELIKASYAPASGKFVTQKTQAPSDIGDWEYPNQGYRSAYERFGHRHLVHAL
jgi:hypothetical protein